MIIYNIYWNQENAQRIRHLTEILKVLNTRKIMTEDVRPLKFYTNLIVGVIRRWRL